MAEREVVDLAAALRDSIDAAVRLRSAREAWDNWAESPDGQQLLDCSRCERSGEVPIYPHQRDDTDSLITETCPRCFGKGKLPKFMTRRRP